MESGIHAVRKRVGLCAAGGYGGAIAAVTSTLACTRRGERGRLSGLGPTRVIVMFFPFGQASTSVLWQGGTLGARLRIPVQPDSAPPPRLLLG